MHPERMSALQCFSDLQITGSGYNADADPVGLECSLGHCISNKLPRDVSAAGPQTTF